MLISLPLSSFLKLLTAATSRQAAFACSPGRPTQVSCLERFPSGPAPPGNWLPSAFDSLAYLVIYWVHVKIKWVKILLFKQQGKEHQKGVHFISPVLIKSSMK